MLILVLGVLSVKGYTIEGVVVEKKFNIDRWNHNLYVIRLADGRCREVWGCYRLEEKMDEVKIRLLYV